MAGQRRPGVYGHEALPDEIDAGTLCRAANPARGPVDGAEAPFTAEQKALLADVVQMALDLVGIVEPTPFADTIHGAIALAGSDWPGAGINPHDTLPYVGDTAKTVRLPRWLANLDECSSQSASSRHFAGVVQPLLLGVYCALDRVPGQAMQPSMRGPGQAMRSRLAALLGTPGRVARASGLLVVLRSKVDDPDMVLDVIEAGVRRNGPAAGLHSKDDFLADMLRELDNFEGKPALRVASRPELATRASDSMGGSVDVVDARGAPTRLKAGDMGRYLAPGRDLAGAADRDGLAVARDWNRMSAIELQQLPAGAVVLDGIARAQAGFAGGRRQLLHLGQMSPDGRVLRAPDRQIIDGFTRLPGGKLSGSH